MTVNGLKKDVENQDFNVLKKERKRIEKVAVDLCYVLSASIEDN